MNTWCRAGEPSPVGVPPVALSPQRFFVIQAAEQCDLLGINNAARKDELAQKQILPRATYEQIKYKIIAKQK